MRLALVVPSLSCGGAERQISILANTLAEKGHKVILLTFDNPGDSRFYEVDADIEHHAIGIKSESRGVFYGLKNILQGCLKLRKILKEINPGKVISFMDVTSAITILAALGSSYSVIAVNRVDFKKNVIPFKWFLLCCLLYPFASQIVAQTRGGRESLPFYVRYRTRIIPNLVRIPACKKIFENGNASKIVVAVGRLENQKGYDLLLKAFSLVAPKFPDWSLKIWGEGKSRRFLEELRDQLGLKSQVYFPGITQQPDREICGSEIFILSSRYEGFPNALCEAMACGVPPISFDCPNGPSEIIRNNINGILVPAEDFHALAKALEDLMIDEAKRKQIGNQAAEILKDLNNKKTISLWEDVLLAA